MSLLHLIQFNLNKCQAAQANLLVELSKMTNKKFVALLQEPHFRNNHPTSISRKCFQVFHGKSTKELWPRAIIIASKGIELSMIEKLTSRDMVCIYLHKSGHPLLFICLLIVFHPRKHLLFYSIYETTGQRKMISKI